MALEHGPGSWLDHPTGRGTLGRRLVVRVVAIVAVVAALVTVVTTLGTRAILINQLDGQIDDAAKRQVADVEGPPPTSTGESKLTLACSDPYGHHPAPGVDVFGNTVDSVFVATCPMGGFVSSLQREKTPDSTQSQTSYRQEQARARAAGQHLLLQIPADGSKRNVSLPDDLGYYRAMSVRLDQTTLVVALPMSSVHRAVNSLLLIELGVALLALGVSVVVCRAVVVRNLKPLNRLAATANKVSELDLDTGEVNLPVRVSPDLADPATEVGQVGSAFNHMLNNVEGALEARQRSETKVRRFVADASHELRNPLASIRGYAELTARASAELPADASHSLERIQAQATRMSGLVEDMLLLARLDNDQQLNLVPTDLVEVVLNAVSDSRTIGTDHTWTLALPDEPVTVSADPDRLTQVVVNVLSNARKHTPAGTSVHTAVASDDRTATVVIADDGPGIPESVRDTVFERFARADASRTASKEGSTGLGLAIVKAVMEAHHGTTSLQTSSAGTTVTLALPIADDGAGP